MKKYFEKYSNQLYFVFRLSIGLLFLLYGWMKVSAIMAGNLPVVGLMTLAAFVEVVGGFMILAGLLSRYAATICAIQMIFAYFMVHAPKGLNPVTNEGGPAILLFAAFLVVMAFGSRKYSLDNLFKLPN